MKRTLYMLLCALLMQGLPATAQPESTSPTPVRNVILMIGDGMGLAQVASWMIENRYEPVALDRAQYTAPCMGGHMSWKAMGGPAWRKVVGVSPSSTSWAGFTSTSTGSAAISRPNAISFAFNITTSEFSSAAGGWD